MSEPVIQVCIPPTHATFAGAFGRDTLLSELKERGLTLRGVEHPESAAIVLLFSALEGPYVASLDAAARARTVLVAEGAVPRPEESEAAREAAGLLGLIEPRAWSNWRSGLVVTWGVYGQPAIAAAAGLVPLETRGLQQADKRALLVDVLARFLVAAESLASG